MSDDDKLPLACDRCHRIVRVNPTQVGNPRPPMGWTKIDDDYWCSDCWNDAYVARATSIAIYPHDGDWDALRSNLKMSFGAVRSIANWAYGKLLAAEPPRDPMAEKMPPRPAVYLYGLREECPAWKLVPASIANAVLTQVSADYSADRLELWLGRKSQRCYRYPQPIPIPAQCWELLRVDVAGGKNPEYFARVNLGSGSVMLSLGPREHQRKICDSVLANPLLKAGVKIVEKRSFSGDTNARENSGGQVFKSSLRLEMSFYSARETREPGESVLTVSTGRDGLLTAVLDGERVWEYHADHAKRLVAKHTHHMSRLQRLSDDRKAERRKPKRDSRPYCDMVAHVCEMDRNRMTSLCHQVSASLVEFAKRRRVATIVYNDKDKSFCGSFPWAKLSTMIDQKARAAKIKFELSVEKKSRKKRAQSKTSVQ